MNYPSTGARFEAWLDSEWLNGTSWREAIAGNDHELNLVRCAFIAGIQSETQEIVDLQAEVTKLRATLQKIAAIHPDNTSCMFIVVRDAKAALGDLP